MFYGTMLKHNTLKKLLFISKTLYPYNPVPTIEVVIKIDKKVFAH